MATVKTVTKIAQQNNINKVKHITLEVGEESGYVPLYLRKLFPVDIDSFPLLKEAIYMRKSIWPLALKLYHMFVKYSVWMKEGGWKGEFYKKGIMLAPDIETHTSTVVLTLNVDVTEKGKGVGTLAE